MGAGVLRRCGLLVLACLALLGPGACQSAPPVDVLPLPAPPAPEPVVIHVAVPDPAPEPDPLPTPRPDPIDNAPPEAGVVARSAVDWVEKGTPRADLEPLPTPRKRVARERGGEVWVYVLDEQHPEGGAVHWEIHIVDGLVVASFAF